MPDLSWLTDADADTRMSAALVTLCLLIAVLALLIRAERQIRGGIRLIGRWSVRGGRWVARRWDARWQGCPHCTCTRCLRSRRASARARWAANRAARRAALTLTTAQPHGDTR